MDQDRMDFLDFMNNAIEPYAFEPRKRDDDSDDDWRHHGGGSDNSNASIDPSRAKAEYAQDLLGDLKRLQSDGTCSDVTITVGGKEFRGHRCILVAVSTYFKDMFASGLQESQINEVELTDIDEDVFETIFNFIYSGEMDICNDNVIEVFNGAVYLGVQNAERAFMDFYIDALRYGDLAAVDVLPLWPAVNEQGMKRLAAAVSKQLLEDFQKIVKSDLFLDKVPSDVIRDYLKHYLKRAGSDGSEEQLLCHIVRWLKHDWETRKIHAHAFLKRFRLGVLPRDKVRELMDAQIQEIPECKKMMDDLTAKWTQFGDVDDLLKLPESLLPRGMMRTIIAFGGKREITDGCYRHELKAEEMSCFAHYFNKKTRQWTLLTYPELPGSKFNLQYPSMVVCNRDIYLAGGMHDKNEYSDDVTGSRNFFKLDGNTYKWIKLPRMNRACMLFSMFHHDGYIYAIGGRGKPPGSKDVGYLDSAERYSISQKKWELLENKLPGGLAYTSKVVLDGEILVYGVTDYEEDVSKYMLVRFDPVTQSWTEYLREEYPDNESVPSNSIMVHEGVCYRIRYEEVQPANRAGMMRAKHIPHVNRIDIKPAQNDEGIPTVSIGPEMQEQDKLPNSDAWAFHIDGHIYINVSGFVHKTGAVLGNPGTCVSELNGWSRCQTFGAKCAVEYVFDTKKMR